MKTRNLAMLTVAASALLPVFAFAGGGVTFFGDQGQFEAAALGEGKFRKGMETYEEATIGDNQIVAMDDPLDSTTDNDWFNSGDIEDNLRVQSNIGGIDSSQLNPHGPPGGLALMGNGYNGTTSKSVIADFFVDALDLIMLSEIKTAVGFNLITWINPSSTLRIDVYDTSNSLIGNTVVAGNPAGTNFLGILASPGQFIGRVNIFDLAGGAEGADNIQMWNAIPEPGTFVALGVGLAMLAGLRRRK